MSAARRRLAALAAPVGPLLVALASTLLAGALLVGGTAATAQQRDWKVQRLGSGITLQVGTARIAGALVEVQFARAEANGAHIRILTPSSAFEQRKSKQLKSAIPDGLAMRDFAGLTGAAAVLAGGYVSSFSPVQPLGYVRSDGQVSSRSHKSWLVDAMLCANWQRFELGPFDEIYRNRDSYADCLQIGPLVLQDGRRRFGGGDAALSSSATKLLRARQRQGFVCRDGEGALLIGVSAEVPLDDFIPFLAKPPAQGGLGCRTAARVTGSTTATLATQRNVFGPDKYLLPTAVAILPGR